MSAATRRDFLGGALAGAALPLLGSTEDADAATTVPQAKQRVVRRGRAIAVSRDGRRVVVAHDMRTEVSISARGHRRPRIVDVGGQPVAVAISPDGALAAVATASWTKPGVALIELSTGHVRARHRLGPAPRDLAFSPNGEHLLVIGGEQEGTLHILDAAHLARDRRVKVGRVPRGLAIAPDSRRAWVTLEADNRIVGVDLHSGQRLVRDLAVPALPNRLAISPNGRRLLLTHGGDDTQVSEIELAGGRVHRHQAGRHPSAVAWTRSGHRLVALGGESAVLDLDGRRRRVDPAPRDLAVAGRRFFTVSALTGQTSGGRL